MTTKLDGQVALVTESTRGIGLGSARELVRVGATVLLNGIESDDQGREIPKEFGPDAAHLEADLSKLVAIEAMMAKTEPRSIWDVANREKDLQYASRAVSRIKRQRQIHRLRHVIASLAAKLPSEALADSDTRELMAYGCRTQMHVVRLLAPRLKNEDHTKDVDFSAHSIETRWEAGLADTRAALAAKPWLEEHDPNAGLVLRDMASVMSSGTSIDEPVAAEVE